jgi:hypothetical protein
MAAKKKAKKKGKATAAKRADGTLKKGWRYAKGGRPVKAKGKK